MVPGMTLVVDVFSPMRRALHFESHDTTFPYDLKHPVVRASAIG